MSAHQLEMACFAHEWNKLNTYRSLVPLQHLSWQLARNVRFTDQKLFNVVKGILIRSLAYCKFVSDYLTSVSEKPIKEHKWQKGDSAHSCHQCDIEVFNLLFVKEVNAKFHVFCFQCARMNNLDEYIFLHQHSFDELSAIFDQFQLHPKRSSALVC
jgi:histone demethylase